MLSECSGLAKGCVHKYSGHGIGNASQVQCFAPEPVPGAGTKTLAKLELSEAEATVHYYTHFESLAVLTIN